MIPGLLCCETRETAKPTMARGGERERERRAVHEPAVKQINHCCMHFSLRERRRGEGERRRGEGERRRLAWDAHTRREQHTGPARLPTRAYLVTLVSHGSELQGGRGVRHVHTATHVDKRTLKEEKASFALFGPFSAAFVRHTKHTDTSAPLRSHWRSCRAQAGWGSSP